MDTLWGPRAGPEEHTRKASDVHIVWHMHILFARTRTRITVTEPHTHRHTGTYTLYTLYKTADVTLTIKRGRGRRRVDHAAKPPGADSAMGEAGTGGAAAPSDAPCTM